MSLEEVPPPLAVVVDKLCQEVQPSTLELVAAAIELLSRCDFVEWSGRCSRCLLAQAMKGSDTCERCNL